MINIIYFIALILAFTFYISTMLEFIKRQKLKKYIKSQKPSFNFENIYNTLYSNHIYDLEKIRKKIILSIIFELLLFIMIPFIMMISSLIVFIVLIIIVVLEFIRNNFKSKYTLLYKNNIIKKFVLLINKNLSYSPNGTLITKSDYREASFNNLPFDIFIADDFITGSLSSDITLNLCNVHIQNEVKTRTIKEIFNGTFAYTVSKKSIGTSIKISKNKMKIFKNSHLIDLDSSEFEKYFDVYSKYKILTLRLLTSEVMQMLVDFNTKYGLDFEIVLKNNKIYFRFFTGPMFEPKIFGNSMDKKLLWLYYSILKFIIDVTEKINNVSKDLEI